MISNFFLSYPAITRQRHLQMSYLCTRIPDANVSCLMFNV